MSEENKPDLSDPFDTPRTDGQILWGSNTLNQGSYVKADFARQLEREIEKLKKEIKEHEHKT
jgi:hypothetical protein